MAHLSSEHFHRRRSLLLALGVLASSFVMSSGSTQAADPPRPDFFWPYGTVQLDGANIEPAQQPVIALVRGRACGEDTSFTADPGPGVPPADEGKTVYVVNVLAEGAEPGQRAGCGLTGDAVMLYFPGSHRIATQQPAFSAGGQRVDLDLGPELSFRLAAPLLSSDGTN